MYFDGIFDVSEKVKIVDADGFSESSSIDDDDETMADVDLFPEIDTPEFCAQASPVNNTKAQLTYRQLSRRRWRKCHF